MIVKAGTFILSATGFTTVPTMIVTYQRIGNLVSLFLPTLSGTSNANTFTLTGLLTELIPGTQQGHEFLLINDNAVQAVGSINVDSTGVITVYPTTSNLTPSAWTASGTKASIRKNLVYHL